MGRHIVNFNRTVFCLISKVLYGSLMVVFADRNV
jgi:hypothetical protein